MPEGQRERENIENEKKESWAYGKCWKEEKG